MNTQFLNNPIVHGVVAFLTFGLGLLLSQNNPWMALTIGAVLKAGYSWLVSEGF